MRINDNHVSSKDQFNERYINYHYLNTSQTSNIVIIGDQAFEEIEQKSLDISKTQIALRFDNKLYTPSFAMEGAYLSIKDYLNDTPKINFNDYCIG